MPTASSPRPPAWHAICDALAYGRHAPLGGTLDVPEERDPGKYTARHALDCTLTGCGYRCKACGFHACLCFPKDNPEEPYARPQRGTY